MLGPLLCGLPSEAPLLPKLRGHFAEFLGDASPAGLGILSPSTCVGLRYGRMQRHSGFSRHALRALPYSCFGPLSHRSRRSRHALCACVPAVLAACGAGMSTCCPSAAPLGLALGPDCPREDRLHPGDLGYPAWGIPTPISLLIPAFSLPACPQPLAVLLRPCRDAPLPTIFVPRLRRRVSAPDIFGAGPLG